MPKNIVSGIGYKGQNIGELVRKGYKSEEWGTFIQWRELGYKVKKGERGTHCRTFGQIENVKAGKVSKDSYIKYFVLFNKEQVELIIK